MKIKKFKGGKVGRVCNRPPTKETITRIRKNHLEHKPIPTGYRFDQEKLFLAKDIKKTILQLKNSISMSEEEKITKLNSINDEYSEELFEYVTTHTEIWYYIPTQEEYLDILQKEHSLGHLGEKKLKKRLEELKILYPGSKKLIHNYVQSCIQCQTQKSPKKIAKVPVHSIISEYPAQHIYIDLSFMTKMNKEIGIL